MMRRLLLAVMLLSLCFMATPLRAAAFDPFGSNPSTGGVDCSGDAKSSAVCTDKTSTDPISGSNGVLLKITKIVAFVGGAAAVIVLLIGSLRYITSNGDANAISSAKQTIIGAIIGLVVIVIAASLITFVVEKLKL
jgi:hypothetical protein